MIYQKDRHFYFWWNQMTFQIDGITDLDIFARVRNIIIFQSLCIQFFIIFFNFQEVLLIAPATLIPSRKVQNYINHIVLSNNTDYSTTKIGGCNCLDKENVLCEIHRLINSNITFFEALNDLHYITQSTEVLKGRDVTKSLNENPLNENPNAHLLHLKE